jgi:hypothetical protein
MGQRNWTCSCNRDSDIGSNKRESSEPDEKSNWKIHIDSEGYGGME